MVVAVLFTSVVRITVFSSGTSIAEHHINAHLKLDQIDGKVFFLSLSLSFSSLLYPVVHWLQLTRERERERERGGDREC